MATRPKLDPEELLYGMDIEDEDEREFFISCLTMGLVPQEQIRELEEQSLLRVAEEWYMELEHAAAVRDIKLGRDNSKAFDPKIMGYPPKSSPSNHASAGDDGTGAGNKVRKAAPKELSLTKPASKTAKKKAAASHFWEEAGVEVPVRRSRRIGSKQSTPVKGDDDSNKDDTVDSQGGNPEDIETTENDTHTQTTTAIPLNSPPHNDNVNSPTKENPANPKPQRVYKSPFFSTNTPTKPQSSSSHAPKPRPARGTISCLPIPPLGADTFGLIQEELASDPFRLLIAITFLIRTSGKSAIPVFRQLMDRFPTPEAIAIADPAEITTLMHPLGLSVVRTAKIQKYARMWLTSPPCKERRYLVKDYPTPGDGNFAVAGQEFGPEPDTLFLPPRGGDQEAGAAVIARQAAVGYAWEIGHLTQGRYALDSWRIFCRDVLLGRAEDWKGKGREAEFQPEWMRTLPEDKELRACLRWMWMKEGWEWDPRTGEREPLREELRRAVDEGRVGYDDVGNLVILR